jgi:hypothetical protein
MKLTIREIQGFSCCMQETLEKIVKMNLQKPVRI